MNKVFKNGSKSENIKQYLKRNTWLINVIKQKITPHKVLFSYFEAKFFLPQIFFNIEQIRPG